MAGWGQLRSFVTDTIAIRVVPSIETDGTFTGVKPTDPIYDLHLQHVSGPPDDAVAMLSSLKARFVGKPYKEWIDG